MLALEGIKVVEVAPMPHRGHQGDDTEYRRLAGKALELAEGSAFIGAVRGTSSFHLRGRTGAILSDAYRNMFASETFSLPVPTARVRCTAEAQRSQKNYFGVLCASGVRQSVEV